MEIESATLEAEIRRLRQERDDLQIALSTAIEHGDAMEEQLLAANDHLKNEIHERNLLESRLQKLLEQVKQQKNDLEIMLSMVSEHGDLVDHHWLERFTYMEKLSMIDGLTRIANRRAFDTTLAVEWKRCQRSAQPFGIIMCDVDFFKQFNDCYGHQQGDDALVMVASAVIKCCHRPSDLAARYGGEEFVLLLPQTDELGMKSVAENLRQFVRELALPHERSSHGIITVSQGGAVIVPRLGVSPMELVAEADRQLYIAKQSGRDIFRLISLPCQESLC